MSCHEIGRGVDVIMRQVLDMYDEGKISKEAALEMVKKFPKAVHWCDGNEDEGLYLSARDCTPGRIGSHEKDSAAPQAAGVAVYPGDTE